jgi:hypothetical protein
VSRPQRELRVRELLRSLHDHEVEHIVFGAIALGFYGHVRATVDLDIVVRPGQENLGRVSDWLMELDAHLLLRPARRFGFRQRWELMKGANASVLTTLGQVDVVQRLPGLPDWGTLNGEGERYELGELMVVVVARATLIELKRARGSSQDLADIEAIELLERLDD